MSVNQVNDPEAAEKAEVPKQDLAEEAAADTTKAEAGEAASDPKAEVDESMQMRLQILNVVAWLICMVLNGVSQNIGTTSLRTITDQWDTRIAPANYAFAIWGLIYTLISIFAVYQALPNKWVPSRNNEMIFGQIKYVFAINMIGNAIWLVVFMTNTPVGFAFALLDIIAMLATQIFIMNKTTRGKVNVIEFISLRMGFTIYSGWVTAATILNTTFFLKSCGMAGNSAGFQETIWVVIVFYVALVIYILVSFMERNPLYGAIYIWVLFAIKNRQAPHSDIQANSVVCVTILILALVSITGFIFYEKSKGKQTRGLFY